MSMVNTGELKDLHARLYPGSAPRVAVRAPGRVNLIGEHTDYNDGCVLPIAMSQALYVTASPSPDGRIAVHSNAFNETVEFPADNPGSPCDPAWANYVRGVAAMLIRQGIPLKPCRLAIHSDVPLGAGVSSSAALEVGSALALLAMAEQRIQAIPLALLARQAEHEYAHSPCGIMDQFICVLGKARHALMLDCRSQTYEQIPLPFENTTLVIMNTQVKHAIGSSQYPVRQKQCREGLTILQRSDPRLIALRDAHMGMLLQHRSRMDEVVFRRCRHVITEIARVPLAAEAMKAGDAATFGRLMFESHQSLKDDYEVSCTELDTLVDIARQVPGVYGARMTGGGFGGCAIALIDSGSEHALRAAVKNKYDTRFEQPAIVYTTTASEGATIIPL
ncbi:MAG TPA: galactokinase [Phycisphaerae bacterium]|nr:galactokinase [Phycisphaerae bacterium]HRR87070.1 galactokinase [Phycisphaerae bacterium]